MQLFTILCTTKKRIKSIPYFKRKLSFMSGHYVFAYLTNHSAWVSGSLEFSYIRHRSNNHEAFASTLCSDKYRFVMHLTLYCTHYFIARRQIRCIKNDTLCNEQWRVKMKLTLKIRRYFWLKDGAAFFKSGEPRSLGPLKQKSQGARAPRLRRLWLTLTSRIWYGRLKPGFHPNAIACIA